MPPAVGKSLAIAGCPDGAVARSVQRRFRAVAQHVGLRMRVEEGGQGREPLVVPQLPDLRAAGRDAQ